MDINAFQDYSVTSYEQYKFNPFLVFGKLKLFKNKIENQIEHIKNNLFYGHRLLILGDKGVGKTSALFFIKDMLEEAEIKNFVFSHLIENNEHFRRVTKEWLDSVTSSPVYILIDFPDTIEQAKFKRFLDFIWDLITHKNYNKINLVFACNINHYDKSFSYSEIFGKFAKLRLDPCNREELKKLISARLKTTTDKEIGEIFSEEALDIIYAYSIGFPRNIISACSLLVENSKGLIKKEDAEEILKEEYIEQILNDRVEDPPLKKIYIEMVNLLKNDFKGICSSQEEYIKKVKSFTNLGRNTIIKNINELVRIGVFRQNLGGEKRRNKIISLN